MELNAEGKAANWLRLTASAAAIRAISDDTGTPAFDGKQVINVPHLRTAAFADLTLPHMRGLHLMPGWSYSGRKEATRDDLVSVPGYNLFNLGARYTPGGEQGRVTLQDLCGQHCRQAVLVRYWRELRRYFYLAGRANDSAALSALHFLNVSIWCSRFLVRDELAMSVAVKAHGMDGTLVEPDWAPLTMEEVRALFKQFPKCGEPTAILSVSPRPFSAASVVAAEGGNVFIKRHHRTVRNREGLLEEHRFLNHLWAHGAAVPRVFANASGETAIESGEWTYEVHEAPAGVDLYGDSLSWTPFRTAAHARSAGQALARLHRAAEGFDAPRRKPRPLVASFTIFAAPDAGDALQHYLEARPALAGDKDVRRTCRRRAPTACAVSCGAGSAAACSATAVDAQRSARVEFAVERCGRRSASCGNH